MNEAMNKVFKNILAGIMVIAGCTIFLGLNQATAQILNSKKMSKKILFVVTSHNKLGETGEATGYYLGEVTHPWAVLVDAGYEIDFVSPKGGNPPYYGANNEDPAVCHGPAGLVNIKLSNGKYLVDGKKINAFTNEEEIAVKLENVVPFSLETKLIERGAKFEKSGLWQPHVTVDQRVVTGQNPQSAHGVGEAVLKELQKL